MRVALISLDDELGPESTAMQVPLAGRPLALRQLDFVVACGCERVIAIGQPSGEAAKAVRTGAHAAGIRIDVASNAHALLGTVTAADELLVLSPGLLAGSALAVEAVATGQSVLTIPADPGVEAGFERIDRDRAWAGVALVPGRLAERLAELPGDSAPASALLRIALQAHLTRRPLPDSVLVDGSWGMITPDTGVAELENRWRQRFRVDTPRYEVSSHIAGFSLERWGHRLLSDPHIPKIVLATVGALLVGAIVLAWAGYSAAALAIVAITTPINALGMEVVRIGQGPFPSQDRRLPVISGLPWARDICLFLCGALAIPGLWFERLFPLLVLFGMLYLKRRAELPLPLAILSDRLILGLIIALGAAFGHTAPIIMLLGLIYLGAELKRVHLQKTVFGA